MCSLVDKQKIIIEHCAGKTNRKIAKEMGLNRKTVNKYVTEYEEARKKELAELLPGTNPLPVTPYILVAPKYDSSNRAKTVVTDEVLQKVKMCLEENESRLMRGAGKQQMRTTDIHEYLTKTCKITISYSSVKRAVRALKSPKHEEAFIKQEYKPGDIVEFDWGDVKVEFPDSTDYITLKMAVFTPAYSNYRWAKLYYTEDTEAFLDAHISFIEFCGGVFLTYVYDNTRVAVKKFVGEAEERATDTMKALAAHYGFKYRFCAIRSGWQKGHVERAVDVVRHWAFVQPGDDRFDNILDADSHIQKKCLEKNKEPISDGRIPAEFFLLEKQHLRPAPIELNYTRQVTAVVNKYSLAEFQRNFYSVPDDYVGRTVQIYCYVKHIDIYCDGKQICTWARGYSKLEYYIDLFHFVKTLKRKPGAIAGSTALHQANTLVQELYHRYYSGSPELFPDVLFLIREQCIRAVMRAAEELYRVSPHDMSAEKLKLICEKKAKENTNEAPPIEDRISRIAQNSLSKYDMLREIQSAESMREVS